MKATNNSFISNCLFEALKAKLNDWNNVKIHFIPAKLNNGNLHFYWYDIKDQSVNQFTHRADIKNNILFKGELSSHNISLFESKLYSKMANLNWSNDKQKAYANKKGFYNLEPFSIKVKKGY